ncbi:YfcE family phosphodiesterase [Candidatus Woesearchaeota archaeon]|nr:YfcE family phosphodiesterase [Candidatus Woesearchaeota archaeon]
MIIGVISDSHDNIWNLEKALNILKEKNVAALFHCGDLCAPFIIKDYLAKFGKPVHCVYGNIDDREATKQLADEAENVTLYGDIAEFELAGKKIAICHMPAKAEELAKSGRFDIVFYGHEHKSNIKKIGKTLFVNPGEIMGRLGKPSFAIWDTDTDKIEIEEF